MSADIFISYSSKELAEAEHIKKILEDNGFTCWMAPESIPYGSNYKLEIPGAIKNCKAVIFIMSENSQKSIWVQKEITDAINQKKLVIPYMIQNCKLQEDFSFILNDVQQVPAYKDEKAALTKVIQDVRHALNVSDDSEVRISIRKKHNPIMIVSVLIAALLITYFGIRMLRSPGSNEFISASSGASVYYSEILPYTEAGYYESFEKTSGIVKNSLDTNYAFSILSFIRNKGNDAAFVESISCDLLKMDEDLSARVSFDAYITDDNVLKIFAINDGWGDSEPIQYSLFTEAHSGIPEFSSIKETINEEKTCSVQKENIIQIGEYPLDLTEVNKWAEENLTTETATIAHLIIRYKLNETEQEYFAYMLYHKDTQTITLEYSGRGDSMKYSITLYAMLDVDQHPSSIRFTGSNAAPLVQDTFRIETVIIPTKSVSLECQGVYSIQGKEQKTDVYQVHVKVPVFKQDYFAFSGPGTKKLAEISFDDEHAVRQIISEARYNPEVILDGHLAKEG